MDFKELIYKLTEQGYTCNQETNVYSLVDKDGVTVETALSVCEIFQKAYDMLTVDEIDGTVYQLTAHNMATIKCLRDAYIDGVIECDLQDNAFIFTRTDDSEEME